MSGKSSARQRIGTLVLLCTLFAAPSVHAIQQEPAKSQNQEPFKLSVGTHLVLVPVIVTDKNGAHVSGLAANEFEVKEEGKVQTVVRLDELTAETSKVKSIPVDPKRFTNEVVAEHPKKLEIIALDQVNTPFASARDGSRAVVEFLAHNVDANTLLALVALTHNGPRIIHNFTSDPNLLIAAVNKAQATLNARDTRVLNSPGDSSEADFEALQIVAVLNGSVIPNSSDPAAFVKQMSALAKGQRADVDASRQAQEALITLESFQQIAQYFRGVPGRKSLIWASTGFPFSLGSDARASTRGTTNDDWQRTLQVLTDANIAVYPVDIGGLLPGTNPNNIQAANQAALQSSAGGDVSGRSAMLEGVNNGAFTDPTIARQSTMRELADMTGGQPFYNSNDGAELFRRAGDDAGQYYVAAYYTKDTGKYGWRKLAVKVDRPGVKVRARSGFFFLDPKKEAEPNAALKDLRMAMTSELSFTSFPFAGEWKETEEAGKQKKVHFTLSIPAGVAAIDSEHENHISLEFLVRATDASGKEAAVISQRFDTKLSPDGVKQMQTQGIDYANALTLAPDNYKVHFVVRDNLRGTVGSIVAPLKVE
jgi:VWFA-related protein